MDHRILNSLIVAAAVFLVGLVVLAILYGPTPNPGESANDDAEPTPATAVSTPEPTPEQNVNASPAPAEADPTPTPTEVPTRSIAGVVVDAETDEPLGGVTVALMLNDEEAESATTGETGEFEFPNAPDEATLVFSMDGYVTSEESMPDEGDLRVALASSLLAGRIVDANGEPVFDATVASGEELSRTDQDGHFQLDGDQSHDELVVKAPGYFAQTIPVSEFEGELTLQDKEIKGLYATAGAVADNERFSGLLDLIDRTELNAIVLDIKDSSGHVFHDTDVETAHEIDAVLPMYSLESVIDELNARGIYAIARIVIFEDPILAVARPELAIQDSQEGGVWRTFTGLPWTNPYREEVWDYNIQLMHEAAAAGFDEVQLDYMRFPTDGPLNRADYGQESNAETRDGAIAAFLERSYEALGPTTTYLTGDIFGMTLWDPTEGEIGQNLVTVAERLDYVHPMIYPSHFYEGAMGFEVPNDHPYEVILQSLEHGVQYLDEHQRVKLRPWLQDFSYGVGIDYGPTEVREQIRAAEDFGVSGWMLWNAAVNYHEEALESAP